MDSLLSNTHKNLKRKVFPRVFAQPSLLAAQIPCKLHWNYHRFQCYHCGPCNIWKHAVLSKITTNNNMCACTHVRMVTMCSENFWKHFFFAYLILFSLQIISRCARQENKENAKNEWYENARAHGFVVNTCSEDECEERANISSKQRDTSQLTTDSAKKQTVEQLFIDVMWNIHIRTSNFATYSSFAISDTYKAIVLEKKTNHVKFFSRAKNWLA